MKGENKDGEETGPVNEKLLCGQQRPFKRPRVKVTQGGEILRDVMSPGRGTTGLLFAQNLHLVTCMSEFLAKLLADTSMPAGTARILWSI